MKVMQQIQDPKLHAKVIVVAIIGIVVLELASIVKGIDGARFNATLFAIGTLAGVSLGHLLRK